MRVLLSAHGSRGDVQPVVGFAVRLRGLRAEVPVCAPPDFAARPAEVAAAGPATPARKSSATNDCEGSRQ